MADFSDPSVKVNLNFNTQIFGRSLEKPVRWDQITQKNNKLVNVKKPFAVSIKIFKEMGNFVKT